MPSLTDCHRITPHLWPFVAGELDDDTRQRVEGHLDGCPSCHEELIRTRGMQQLLRAIGSMPVPDPARERLEGFLDELPEPPAVPEPSPAATLHRCHQPWPRRHHR